MQAVITREVECDTQSQRVGGRQGVLCDGDTLQQRRNQSSQQKLVMEQVLFKHGRPGVFITHCVPCLPSVHTRDERMDRLDTISFDSRRMCKQHIRLPESVSRTLDANRPRHTRESDQQWLTPHLAVRSLALLAILLTVSVSVNLRQIAPVVTL
jgi:hypothetical protein